MAGSEDIGAVGRQVLLAAHYEMVIVAPGAKLNQRTKYVVEYIIILYSTH